MKASPAITFDVVGRITLLARVGLAIMRFGARLVRWGGVAVTLRERP